MQFLVLASEAEVRPKARSKNNFFASDKHSSLLCLTSAETLEQSGSVQKLFFSLRLNKLGCFLWNFLYILLFLQVRQK